MQRFTRVTSKTCESEGGNRPEPVLPAECKAVTRWTARTKWTENALHGSKPLTVRCGLGRRLGYHAYRQKYKSFEMVERIAWERI